jgi:hypothetical protein
VLWATGMAFRLDAGMRSCGDVPVVHPYMCYLTDLPFVKGAMSPTAGRAAAVAAQKLQWLIRQFITAVIINSSSTNTAWLQLCTST